MKSPSGVERWAAACIEAHMPDVTVRPYDDNSRPAMHDLDLFRDDDLVGACEVTAAADRQLVELWDAANGSELVWQEPRLSGTWIVHLEPHCRFKLVRQELPPLLEAMERRNEWRAGSEPWEWPHTKAFPQLRVNRVERAGTRDVGAIFPLIAQGDDFTGGTVPRCADPLLDWLEPWVASPEQQHNIDKLVASGSPERHLYVIFPGFTPAPFEVTACLLWDVEVPTRSPDLPPGLTHLWAMSGWDRGNVLAWGPGGWSWSSKVSPTF